MRGGDSTSPPWRIGHGDTRVSTRARTLSFLPRTVSWLHKLEAAATRFTLCSLVQPQGCTAPEPLTAAEPQATSNRHVSDRREAADIHTRLEKLSTGMCLKSWDCERNESNIAIYAPPHAHRISPSTPPPRRQLHVYLVSWQDLDVGEGQRARNHLPKARFWRRRTSPAV